MCAGPIGLADHAPKHAHIGRLPRCNWVPINAVNVINKMIASTAGTGSASWATNAAPTAISNHGTAGTTGLGAPSSLA